jgi:TetR/AcrR family transcriptional regulator, repressor for uid operon
MAIIVDKEKKKKEIIHAARVVFRSKGFYNCSIAQIAREAGIGKGTIYEYFTSKDELFLEVFFDVFDQIMLKMIETMDTERRPVKKIKLFFENMAQFYDEMKDELSLLFEFWGMFSRQDEKGVIDLNIGNYYMRFVEHFARIFEEGKQRGTIRSKVSSQSAAFMLLALTDGIAFQSLYNDDPPSPHELLNDFAEIIFNGILTEKGKLAQGEEQ